MTANRHQYAAEFKARVVLEVLSGEKTPSKVCRTHKHKRIARLMKEMGLCGKVAKRRQRTTNSNHEFGHYSSQH